RYRMMNYDSEKESKRNGVLDVLSKELGTAGISEGLKSQFHDWTSRVLDWEDSMRGRNTKQES
ncbi:hypothetical protein L0Y49_04560, partial [bacterium]|nr:hypothetical protein [bacterium]